jgi:hypothetical protein
MQSRHGLLSAMLALCCVTSVPAASEAPRQKPLALHPDNPHYFLFRGKAALLISSAEHYGAVLNLDFDYGPYLKELADKGLNQTRCFSGVYREVPGSFNIKGNTLAPQPDRYSSPWADAGTGGSDKGGGRKYDLTKWNDAHFKRMRDYVGAAGEHGVVVELVLFCPFYEDVLWDICPLNAKNNVNGVGKDVKDRKDVNTLKHKDVLAAQEALTRKVVTELREFDNVYYEICNEPYFGGADEWQRRIGAVIVETEKELKLPQQHLIAQNISNGSKKIENPDPNVSIFNFHYCNPPDAVGQNYGLNRAIAYDETGFKGSGDDVYRVHAWQFILAGGAEFSHLDYSFTAKTPAGTGEVSAPGGGGRTIRRQLLRLQVFLLALDYVRMRPDRKVLKGELPKGVTAYALAEPGKQYALYFSRVVPEKNGKNETGKMIDPADGQALSVKLELPAGEFQLEWFNPRTGNTDHSTRLKHAGGEAALESPSFSQDIALRMKAAR